MTDLELLGDNVGDNMTSTGMNVLIYLDDLPTSEYTLDMAALWLSHIPGHVTLMTTLAQGGQSLLEAGRARLPAAVRAAATLRLSHEDPVHVLGVECIACEYDLLIVAPAGRGWLGRMVRGSRIGQITRSVNTSVLVARPARPSIRNILVGVGTAEHSLTVVRTAIQVAQAFDAQVSLLHVVSQMPLTFTGLEPPHLDLATFLESGLGGARTLAAARQLVREAGLVPHAHLREGLVRDAIIEDAVKGGYDLLVVGGRPADDEMASLLADIAGYLVRHCPLPMLAVYGTPEWA